VQSMNQGGRRVIGGVDAHADSHHAAALDDRGALLETKSFNVSAAGYRDLLAWLRSFGAIDRIGVESTGSFAAGLTRHLVAQGVQVLEVNQPHAHTRRRRGKTDAIDAELAARHALSLATAVTPKQTTGIVEAIRQLRIARDSAVKSRSAAMLQLGGLILTAPSELREQLATPKTLNGKAGLCRRLRPDASRLSDPVNAAKLALRSLARRIGPRRRDRRARHSAHTARRDRRATNHCAAGHLHRARQPAAPHRRPEHRPAPQRGRVRRALRRQPHPRRLGQTRPLPPEPRQRPPSQPSPAHDRRLPTALLPGDPRLRRTAHRRGQDQEGDHALPQALHRPRGLRQPPRRPQISLPLLTSIGTSQPGSAPVELKRVGPDDNILYEAITTS
jgi:hypothetical protein